MKAVIVYESMYGNTHVVADHIADALRPAMAVDVVSPGAEAAALVATADLVVVGGPTHVHGMTTAMSRKAAVTDAEKKDDLELDPDAEGPGLRDWFGELAKVQGAAAAAFDTRMDGPPSLTGRASKGIARRLRGHGFDLAVEPESFLVDKENHLEAGEADRAQAWGTALAEQFVRIG